MIWKTDENHPRLPWGVAGADTSGIVRQWEVAAHTSPGAIPVTEQMRPWLSEPIRGLTDFSGSSSAIGQTRPWWLSEPTQGLQICAAITDLIHSGYTEPTIPVNSLDQIQLRYEPSIPIDSFGRIQVGHQFRGIIPLSILPERSVRSSEIDVSELTAAVAKLLSDKYRYDVRGGRFECRSATSKSPSSKSEEAGKAMHADEIKKTDAADSQFGTEVGKYPSRRGAIAPTTEALIKAGVHLVLRDNYYSRVESRFAAQMIDFANEQGLWGPDDALVANSGSAKAVAKAVLWAVKLLE